MRVFFISILMVAFILNLNGCNDNTAKKSFSSESSLPKSGERSLMSDCKYHDTLMERANFLVGFNKRESQKRSADSNVFLIDVTIKGVSFPLLTKISSKGSEVGCVENLISTPSFNMFFI